VFKLPPDQQQEVRTPNLGGDDHEDGIDPHRGYPANAANNMKEVAL